MLVCIDAVEVRLLEAAAEAAWPNEACALLEGRRYEDGVTVTRVHPADNVAADQQHEFEADPRVLFRLHRTLRGAPTELVGIWHSHPNGLAELSAVDRAWAYDDSLIWLLTPAANGQAGATKAFRVVLARDLGVSFTPVELEQTG